MTPEDVRRDCRRIIDGLALKATLADVETLMPLRDKLRELDQWLDAQASESRPDYRVAPNPRWAAK